METESTSVTERSRKIYSSVLRVIQSQGQIHVAEALGVHESTVSKMIQDGRIEQFCRLIALLDLKIVPLDAHCYKAEQIEPIFQIAKQALERAKHADDMLLWDDPE